MVTPLVLITAVHRTMTRHDDPRSLSTISSSALQILFEPNTLRESIAQWMFSGKCNHVDIAVVHGPPEISFASDFCSRIFFYYA